MSADEFQCPVCCINAFQGFCAALSCIINSYIHTHIIQYLILLLISHTYTTYCHTIMYKNFISPDVLQSQDADIKRSKRCAVHQRLL